MTLDDRPLDTQASAPPPVPPKRPSVVAAMDDDDLSRLRERSEQLHQSLQALCDRIAAALARTKKKQAKG